MTKAKSIGGFEVVPHGCRDELGEGPIWSARDQAIYWVDILDPSVHRLSLADQRSHTWKMPETVGWLIERQKQPGFIAGFTSGFAQLHLDPLTVQPLDDPEPDIENNRMNDAKVDTAGRIWAGTMDRDGARASGALYRLDPDHSWHKMDAGYLVTNGPTFSPDGRILYHTDTLRRTIYRFDLQPDGTITGKRPLITFPEDTGYPDGMTTDCEGCLWVAHWGGGRITRFTADGDVVRVIPLPATQITSCVFAGPRLDRMFVTSAAGGRTEPLAGELFEIDPGVRGCAATLFGG